MITDLDQCMAFLVSTLEVFVIRKWNNKDRHFACLIEYMNSRLDILSIRRGKLAVCFHIYKLMSQLDISLMLLDPYNKVILFYQLMADN